MDIKRLELFCRIVELKSFTKAAEVSKLSQPSVSEHIRLLEEQLEEKLLDRLGREVLPTPAGEVFYGFARRILRQRDEALQAMAKFRGKVAGHMLLGASSIPGNYILPALVESFKRRYPDVRAQLKIAGSGTILDDLIEGALELALVGAERRDPRLQFTEICQDRLVLVIPRDHRWKAHQAIAAAELTAEPFILREPGSGTRSVMQQALAGAGIDLGQLDTVAEMGSNEAVRQSVKAGLGISILSQRSVVEDAARGEVHLLTLDGLDMQRPVLLAKRRGRQLSPLGAAFEAHLLEQLAADL